MENIDRETSVHRLTNKEDQAPLSSASKHHPRHDTTQLERRPDPSFRPAQQGLLRFSTPCRLYCAVPAARVDYVTWGWSSSPVCLPRRGLAADLWVLNLKGMTELPRNFSALCLNPSVRMVFYGRARFLPSHPCRLLRAPVLCWNMTCKYQTLALVTLPNTAGQSADASGKCLSSPHYVQCRLQADGETNVLPCSPTCTLDWARRRPDERTPGLPRACARPTRHRGVQMLVWSSTAEQTFSVLSTASLV